MLRRHLIDLTNALASQGHCNQNLLRGKLVTLNVIQGAGYVGKSDVTKG